MASTKVPTHCRYSNISCACRSAFVAAEGYTMLSADYRQMELRMMAHASGDSVLCQLLQVHGSTLQ